MGFQKLPGGGDGRAVVAAAWSLLAQGTQSHWPGSADPGGWRRQEPREAWPSRHGGGGGR